MTSVTKTLFGGIVLVAIAAGVFAYVKKANAPAENSTAPAAPQQFVYEDRYGFDLSLPSEFETKSLKENEAYPGRSYVGGEGDSLIPGFLAATLLGPRQDRDFPNFEILVYQSNGKMLNEWLDENSTMTAGFGSKETITLGSQQFVKYSEPAGDLVPGSMYVTANQNYIVQINTDMDLSGRPVAHSAEEVLKTFKFTK